MQNRFKESMAEIQNRRPLTQIRPVQAPRTPRTAAQAAQAAQTGFPGPQAGFLGPQAAFPGLPATPAGRPGPPQQDAPTGCPGFQAAQIGAQAAQIGFSGRPNCCNNLQECPCRQNNAPACKTFLLSTLLISIKHRLVAMSNGPRQVSQAPRPPR